MLGKNAKSVRVTIGCTFAFAALAAVCFGQNLASQASQLESTISHNNHFGPESATAVRAAEQLLALQKQKYGEVSKEFAAALNLAKSAYYVAENGPAMVAVLDQQIDVFKRLYGNDCWQTSGPILDRYVLQFLLQQSRETRLEFVNLYDAKLDTLKSAIKSGRFAEAHLQIDNAKQWIVALFQNQSVSGDQLPVFATYLREEARLLVAENKLEEALRLQRQAVSIRLGILGAQDPTHVEYFDYLGQLLELAGDNEGAEFEYRRAVDCAKATFETPVREKEMLLQLVRLFSKTGRHGDAIAVAKELERFARSAECPSARKFEFLQAYAASLRNGGRQQESLVLFEEVKVMLEQSQQTSSTNYQACLHGIGEAKFDLKKYDEALQVYQQFLRRVEKNPQGSDLLLAHLSLGKCHLKLGDLSAAEASLRIVEAEYQKNPVSNANFVALIEGLRAALRAANLDQLYDDADFAQIRTTLDTQLRQYEQDGSANTPPARMARLERDALDQLTTISQLEYQNWLVARRSAQSIAFGTLSADEVVSSAPPAIETIARLIGADNYLLPGLRYRLAMALRDKGDFTGAERELRLATQGWDVLWPNDHPHAQQIRSWYELGRLTYHQRGNVAGSISIYLRAASLARALDADRRQLDGSNASQLLGEVLTELSNAQYWSNQLDVAIATTSELVALNQRIYGAKAGRTLASRVRLAHFKVFQGRVDDALSEYETVRAIQIERGRTDAACLRGLGQCLALKGDLQKGESYLRDAIRVYESSRLSSDAYDLGQAYRALGNVCLRTNRFDEGRACYEKCFAIWTEGKIHKELLDNVRSDLVVCHDDAAYRLQLAGKPDLAVAERQAARTILVQLYGEKSSYVRLCDCWIKSHNRQSQLPQADHEKLLSAMNSYQLLPRMLKEQKYAEVCQTTSAEIQTIESLLGPDDPFLLMVRQDYVAGLYYCRRTFECIEEAQRVIALNAKLKGGDDVITGKMLGTQGFALWDQGKTRDASQVFQKQRTLYASIRPFSSLDYGTASLRYAECQLAEDAIVEANEAVQAARDSLRNSAMNNTDRYIEAIVLSYQLAGRMGDRELAGLYLREANELLDQRKLRGTQIEELALRAQCQQSLAAGQWKAADEVSQRWLELATKRIPTQDDPIFAQIWRNRSAALTGQRKWAEAEELCRRAFKLASEKDGTEIAEEARLSILLAEIDAGLGKLDEAQRLAKHAVSIFSKRISPTHTVFVAAREQLARIELARGDTREAESARRENLKLAGETFEDLAPLANEDQLMGISQSLRQALYAYLSLPINVQDNAFVYQEVLRWKGAAFIKRKSLRRAMADPKNAELVGAWQQAGSRLATESLRPPFAEGRAAWLQGLSRLRIEFGALDSRMAKLTQPAPAVTLHDIQTALPKEAVLVDIVAYPHTSPPAEPSGIWTSEDRYVVFVVREGQALQRVDIATAAQIAELIQQWRTLVKDAARLPAEACMNENLPELREVGRQLRSLVWQPLEVATQSASLVIVSPDGPLTALPFAALPGADANTFLVEEKACVTIPAARLLIDSSPKSSSDPALMVMGQVDYGAAPGPATSRNKVGIGGFTQLTMDHLECDAVESSFKTTFPQSRCEYVIKGEPTEGRFRQIANQFKWLHISTHGFFQESFATDVLRRRETTPLPGLESSNSTASDYGLGTLSHPGLQCGIGLAGANVANKPGQDDGILTALEVSLLNLSSVDAIVLSACETALGAIKDGEGVLGLQRAFHQAGVRSVMATLWSVPVDATIGLLNVYYRIQWEGRRDPVYALQEAQSAFIRQARLAEPNSLPAHFEHPYFWAGFSLSSEKP